MQSFFDIDNLFISSDKKFNKGNLNWEYIDLKTLFLREEESPVADVSIDIK